MTSRETLFNHSHFGLWWQLFLNRALQYNQKNNIYSDSLLGLISLFKTHRTKRNQYFDFLYGNTFYVKLFYQSLFSLVKIFCNTMLQCKTRTMYYIIDNDGFHAARYSIETQEILISFLYVHGCKQQLEIAINLIIDVLNFLRIKTYLQISHTSIQLKA